MTRQQLHARVQAGAAWLDDNVDGWRGSVDVNTLDMESPCNCVLGQLRGEYFDACEELRIDYFEDGWRLGFLPYDEPGDTNVLRELWIEELQRKVG